MLIELHLLQNHAPSNLNRDDTNSPKEAFFGGYRRARISSQCLKRSIRKSLLFQEELGDELAFRSKRLAAQVEEVLRETLGADEETAKALARRASVLGSSEKQDKEAADQEKAKADPKADAKKPRKPRGKESGSDSEGSFETKQLIFFGKDEVQAVAEALLDLKEKAGDGFATMPAADIEEAIARKINPKNGGPKLIPAEIALFGRMTTSAAFEDVNAAVQVAHALSTNKLDHEFDFYTAVDDLKDIRAGDDAGAGMVGDVEFNSSCFYKYFSLDWTSFVARVGDRELALRALRGFLRAAALTTPTGKQNSFAAHNPPDLILVECKPRKIPVSYANAFVRPSAPYGGRDLIDDSIARLAAYVESVGETYAIPAETFWLATREVKGFKGKKAKNLDTLISRVQEQCPAAGSPAEVAK